MKVTFHNDKDRRAFVANYHAWGLWCCIPLTGCMFYRCQVNGQYFAVEEYPEHTHKHPVAYKTRVRRFYRWPIGEGFYGESCSEAELVGELHGLRGEYDVITEAGEHGQ